MICDWIWKKGVFHTHPIYLILIIHCNLRLVKAIYIYTIYWLECWSLVWINIWLIVREIFFRIVAMLFDNEAMVFQVYRVKYTILYPMHNIYAACSYNSMGINLGETSISHAFYHACGLYIHNLWNKLVHKHKIAFKSCELNRSMQSAIYMTSYIE